MWHLFILLGTGTVTTLSFHQILHPILQHLPRRMAPPSSQLSEAWAPELLLYLPFPSMTTSTQTSSSVNSLPSENEPFLSSWHPPVTASLQALCISYKDYINSFALSFLILVLSLQFILHEIIKEAFLQCTSNSTIPLFKSLQWRAFG